MIMMIAETAHSDTSSDTAVLIDVVGNLVLNKE